MKDSEIKWIGDIPSEWKTCYAFQLFSPVKNKNTGLIESNLLSLSYGKIKRKSIDTVGGLLPENFDGYNIIRENDIVLRLTDLQNDHKSLRVGLATEQGIITSAYLTLRLDSDNSARYMYYFLHSFDIAKGFYGMGAGVRQGLNWDELKHLEMLLPSKEEQINISKFLDNKCAYIDSVIEKTKESIEEYKKLKQAIITEAVTKGVRGERPMKDSNNVFIKSIPSDWECIKFGKCIVIKSNLVNPDLYPDYPQVAPDNIEKGSAKLLDNILTVRDAGVISWNHLFYKGQIIYSKIRPMLNKLIIAPFDGLCSADMYPIETDNNIVFIKYLMLSELFLAQVGLVTMNRVKMPKINQNELSNIYVPLPDIVEQEEIADYLEQRCRNIDATLEKKQKLLEELELYKKSLIYEYVTGKKEVPTL